MALQLALQPQILVYSFLGCVIGTLVGGDLNPVLRSAYPSAVIADGPIAYWRMGVSLAASVRCPRGGR